MTSKDSMEPGLTIGMSWNLIVAWHAARILEKDIPETYIFYIAPLDLEGSKRQKEWWKDKLKEKSFEPRPRVGRLFL